MKKKIFIETDTSIFQQLVGYTIGEVREDDISTVIRFDKQIENVVISRDVSIGNEGIHETDDYVLDIMPKDEE